ncbi:MAG: diacylglycerol kinase family lipid kinase [Desulfarculus sp.]|nr:diacylglycerol kinase family lipid kinase [Desulfarculus sp.]
MTSDEREQEAGGREAKGISLIVNPVGGRGRGRRYAKRLIQAMRARGLAFEVLETRRRGDARALAQRACGHGADTIVLVGGDGSVHEVIQALAGQAARLAVGPAGRCNDFARSLGPLPRPETLAGLLVDGPTRVLDLVQARGQGFDRYYCTVGAIGFDAQVSRFVDTMRGPLKGQPAYLYGVLRVLVGYRPPMVELTWEGGQYRGPILLVAAANTRTYGNQIPIAPRARPDDGLLELCLVRPAGFWRVLTVLPQLLLGRHGRLPEVSFMASPWLRVESEAGLELWADGEPVAVAPLSLQVEPGALRVLATTPGRS